MSFLNFPPFASTAAIPTPASGRSVLAQAGGQWYRKDDTGTATPIAVLLNGSGAPAASLGEEGDFYLDTTNNDIYGPKTGGVWGSATSIIGPTGPTGPAGPTGPQGDPGPVELLSLITNTTTVTLPNTTTKTLAFTETFNVTQAGDYAFQAFMMFKPHSTGNDFEVDWRIDTAIINGTVSAEEHKDSSGAQAHPRSYGGNLGALTVGNHDLEMFFSKEATGGTAQVVSRVIFIWRTS